MAIPAGVMCKKHGVERLRYPSGQVHCPVCSNEQSKKAYHLRKSDKVRHEHYRRVNAAAAKRWGDLNRDHLRERQRKDRARIRAQCIRHYGGNPPQCQCCGEVREEFLTIDHIGGGGKQHRKQSGISGGSDMYRWLRRNGFPVGFRVLCMNCNFALGHCGYCPHARERESALKQESNYYTADGDDG